MFKASDLQNFPQIEKMQARKHFVRALQNAHAGELAAAWAYTGHGYSLFVWDKQEKAEILKIRDEELHHRKRIREMLDELGGKPRLLPEFLFLCIGLTIAFLCLLGGWFIPMYGAGKLESGNIFEYEVAARLAFMAGLEKYVPELLEFGELEWDHELYFRKKTNSHFLAKLIPLWPSPKAKERIGSEFKSWQTSLTSTEQNQVENNESHKIRL